MRFEARHHFFKRLTQNVGHLSHTLALRHQLLQCYYHQSDAFLGNDMEIGPGIYKIVYVYTCIIIIICTIIVHNEYVGDTVAVQDRPPEIRNDETFSCYRSVNVYRHVYMC